MQRRSSCFTCQLLEWDIPFASPVSSYGDFSPPRATHGLTIGLGEAVMICPFYTAERQRLSISLSDSLFFFPTSLALPMEGER